MIYKTTGQFGEYAVASELCRRGWIATTFTRNMPGFDIWAINMNSRNGVTIQVKTISSGEWSLNAKHFILFDEKQFENGKQVIVGKNEVKSDFHIFVRMKNERRDDEFFIIPSIELQKIIFREYGAFLSKNNGVRPRNPKTTHTAIKKEMIREYEEKWKLLLSPS